MVIQCKYVKNFGQTTSLLRADCQEAWNRNGEYFDRQGANCGAGKAMINWKFTSSGCPDIVSGPGFTIEFQCVDMTANGAETCVLRTTDTGEPWGSHISFFDAFDNACEPHEYLVSIEPGDFSNGPKSINYNCCSYS